MSLDAFWIQSTGQWLGLVLPSQRIFYLYLIAAFVLAVVTFAWFARKPEGARPEGIGRGLFGYIFDPRVWLHRSALQDYGYFFLNAMLYYGIVSQLLVGGHVFYGLAEMGLTGAFGTRDVPLFEANGVTVVLYTLAVVLAIDLAVWSTHYLQHKVRVLWAFHQVHHSAEVLTPITVFRMHPVDLFFTGLMTVGLMGGTLALFVYLTGARPTEATILGVNAITFGFYLLGYNLRHSHIWLSYPVWLSHILISPAMHQIHHSIDTKHWDRNMGLIFAVWDWLFGTLYVPRGYERLEFGVSKEEPNPFSSVREIYLKPFREAWAVLVPAGVPRPRRMLAAVVLVTGAVTYVMLQQGTRPAAAGDVELPSLHLEDLTWTEVDAALKAGYATAIVPTGGVEQNGPHVILGKHNHVVRETSARIARRLGGTLVAPVINYVPEGAVGETPDGHMRWAGTISVPETVFESIVEAAARSLQTHGFRTILLVGDSLGNQEAQARVAERLSREWIGQGVRVIHVGAYYDGNGQIGWLQGQGLSEEQIGFHAGIRDTSELMAVHAPGVRAAPLVAPRGAHPGYSGDYRRASVDIGETMLDLKVEAALRELAALGITTGRVDPATVVQN